MLLVRMMMLRMTMPLLLLWTMTVCYSLVMMIFNLLLLSSLLFAVEVAAAVLCCGCCT